MSSGRPQWRGSDNLLRSPGSGARHSPAHRLDAVGAEGRSRRVRRRRGAREGLSPLSARGVGQAPAAAQPSRKSQPSSPDANPVQEVAGTVVWHGWVPLGPTERPPGARQTCFWALFQRSRANHSYNEPLRLSRLGLRERPIYFICTIIVYVAFKGVFRPSTHTAHTPVVSPSSVTCRPRTAERTGAAQKAAARRPRAVCGPGLCLLLAFRFRFGGCVCLGRVCFVRCGQKLHCVVLFQASNKQTLARSHLCVCV